MTKTARKKAVKKKAVKKKARKPYVEISTEDVFGDGSRFFSILEVGNIADEHCFISMPFEPTDSYMISFETETSSRSEKAAKRAVVRSARKYAKALAKACDMAEKQL